MIKANIGVNMAYLTLYCFVLKICPLIFSLSLLERQAGGRKREKREISHLISKCPQRLLLNVNQSRFLR